MNQALTNSPVGTDCSSVSELQTAFYRHSFQRYELLAPNVYLQHSSEMDLMGIRKSGFVDEIEIKLTRSDFRADFKKITRLWGKASALWSKSDTWVEWPKHECLREGLLPCNYFSFLVPDGLVTVDDIPEYAGLYVLRRGHVQELKKAPRLHDRKISTEDKYHTARKMAYRYWQKFKEVEL